MNNPNKLLLPATIIIASIILGGFFYACQVNKQKQTKLASMRLKIGRKIIELEPIRVKIGRELKELEKGKALDSSFSKSSNFKRWSDKYEKMEGLEERIAFEGCIFLAIEDYDNDWKNECKSGGLLTSECIALNKMTADEYAKKNNIPDNDISWKTHKNFFKQLDKCSCSLPSAIADRINETFNRNKDKCLKRYMQYQNEWRERHGLE